MIPLVGTTMSVQIWIPFAISSFVMHYVITQGWLGSLLPRWHSAAWSAQPGWGSFCGNVKGTFLIRISLGVDQRIWASFTNLTHQVAGIPVLQCNDDGQYHLTDEVPGRWRLSSPRLLDSCKIFHPSCQPLVLQRSISVLVGLRFRVNHSCMTHRRFYLKAGLCGVLSVRSWTVSTVLFRNCFQHASLVVLL